MKDFIRRNAVFALIASVVALISLSAVSVVYNRRVMTQTTELKNFTELALVKTDAILNNLQAIDLGLRGYAITKTKVHFGHYQAAVAGIEPTFDTLTVLLTQQQYDLSELQHLRATMQTYVGFCDQVVVEIERDSVQRVGKMIAQDEGFKVWKEYQTLFAQLSGYEKALNQQARLGYEAAAERSLWVMILLLTISLPTMGFIAYLIKRTTEKRQRLFAQLEQNNRKYNFDPGTPLEIDNESQLIDGYINFSKQAAAFVSQIAGGRYDVQWEGLNESNATLNQDGLAGALVNMRDKMKIVKEEEEQRLWVDRGLAEFTTIIRHYQHELAALAEHTVGFLVKYMRAQQGGLFIVNRDEAQLPYLELAACYAFERKKFTQKRLEFGQGLAGQAYLEGETIFLTEIPDGYTRITSGLGNATSTCLLVVPMKHNEQVQAIVEIAGFVKYQAYQIDFMEKVGELVAAAVASVQTSENNQRLLQQAQQQTEQLLAQEEEMRQNTEELQATQEEVTRRQTESVNLLQKYNLAAQTTSEGLWDMVVPTDLTFTDETPFWWSDRFRQMVGYCNEADFPNRLDSWSNLLHPDHKAATLAAFSAHLLDYSGQTPYDVEYQLKLKAGTYQWFRAVGKTLRNEQGEPLRVAGSLIDIQLLKDLQAQTKK